MYDLLVIGGGPGGATCARRAALRGLDVVLIEKIAHPRDKVCGGALSPKVRDILDFDISKLVEREFTSVAIHRPSGKMTTLSKDGFSGDIIRRNEFDKYLIDKAKKSGVEVIEDTEIIAIEQLRKGIRALSKGDSFKGHLLVGADGVNGISMKTLGIKNHWRPDEAAVCICTEVTFGENEIEKIPESYTNAVSQAIELYFGFSNWGYGWCFPTKSGVRIGLGCRSDRAESIRDDWYRLCKKIEIDKQVDIKKEYETSARIPLGGIPNRHIGRRSMLVGDAAGLVSPVTGEGISYAIESGILAADVAVEAVRSKAPSHIIEYERKLEQYITGDLKDLRTFAEILNRSDKNVELICDISDKDPVFQNYLLSILSRSSAVSDLKNKIVKRLLIHHPLKAIKLGL